MGSQKKMDEKGWVTVQQSKNPILFLVCFIFGSQAKFLSVVPQRRCALTLCGVAGLAVQRGAVLPQTVQPRKLPQSVFRKHTAM